MPVETRSPGLAEQIEGWAPPPATHTDPMSAATGERLAAALGSDRPHLDPDGELPPMWHWAYFQETTPTSQLGPDGHPRAGGFLPPVRDRRRMFAGGRWSSHRPLHLGTPATATSNLAARTVREGRSGELLFVTVRTDYVQHGSTCLVEEQDLVYRCGPGVATGAAPAPDSYVAPEQSIVFDPITLFRFSAATGNAHRIHYDLSYARDVEGHPGLLVHGPLLVLTLVEALRADGLPLDNGWYRLHRPVYCGDPVTRHHDRCGQAELRGLDGSVRASVSASSKGTP